MRASGRLAVYAATLAGVFAVAFVTAGAVVPPEAVGTWSSGTGGHANDHGPQQQQEGHPSSSDADGHGEQRAAMPAGLSLQADGYRFAAVDAPTTPGASGDLTLTVLGPDGEPATDFEVSHEQELHLIVVRTDGGEFRHVHPEVDPRGRWSIPWEWQSSGTYRVYADFVSSGAEASTTLSALVHVAGDFEPLPVEKTSRSTEAGGYLVTITGDLAAGRASTLTVSVTRGGQPVTTLEPYLGAYGHLVALRAGDLAYLHVHPHGQGPEAGETAGPEVVFEATAPTAGQYLLYLDFKVDGQVHTAAFVLDADGVYPPPSAEPGPVEPVTEDGPERTTDDAHGNEHDEGAGHDHDQ